MSFSIVFIDGTDSISKLESFSMVFIEGTDSISKPMNEL
jgi:hypothetical protein